MSDEERGFGSWQYICLDCFEFINCCWPVLKVFLVFIVEEVLDLELEVDHAGSVIHGSVEHI